MKAKKKNSLILVLLIVGAYFVGSYVIGRISSNKLEAVKSDDIKVLNEKSTQEVERPLEDESLFIYCGAGMKKPFDEIVASFQKETGAKVEVTYANTAQLITQIKASGEGDLFIAGDEGELTKIQDEYISGIKALVKHIPVIAVPKGNPKNIQGLMDFANEGVSAILGDNKATPIGKLADKALGEAGILEKVNIKARSVTAPEMATALSLNECDAAILWKENANIEGIEIIASSEMEKYIKIIPAASLKCATNNKALDSFLVYLDTGVAKGIWKKHGYEILE